MKSLEQMLSVLNGYTYTGDKEMAIAGVTADSRKVEKGFLFICLPGATVDGHDFVPQAVEKGACAILAERKVEVPAGVALVLVDDVRDAMQRIVPFFYDYPGQDMRMIGVTGTNGKTTTTHIIGHILRKAGHRVGIIGTVHVLMDDESFPVHNTTPDVVDLQQILFEMRRRGITHVVMEVSSHALDMNRIAGIEFDTAVFTNLTQDHLDYHKTFENYLAAKARLFDLVSDTTGKKEPKTAIVNIDDPYGKAILEHCHCRTWTYGAREVSDFHAAHLSVHAKGCSFVLRSPLGEKELHMNITGLFNVYNAMAAVGAALAEGVEPSVIWDGLCEFRSVPGRFELVEEGQNFAVVVDYAHTPDGLENILQTARRFAKGRIIAVFGCGGDRDRTKRPIMGGIGATYADVVIVTSDNPRTEDPEAIVEEVAQGVKEKLRDGMCYEVIVDRRSAIQRAIKMAQEDDVVLIAGKGHENYQIIGHDTIHFDDREEARAALKERG